MRLALCETFGFHMQSVDLQLRVQMCVGFSSQGPKSRCALLALDIV